MTYPETLDYMFSALPMYHRVGAAAYKADLRPTLDMMDALGNPERSLRCIHVAGTNGKGSVSHLLASILQEAGYKVGLYTSPHLVDFRERIRINGEMISQQAVVDFVQQWRPMFERLHLSFFEMTVGLAFTHFVQQRVDIAVVEVGMGGRLDSTNVVSPLLSVITNIGFDHTQFLGTTLPQIAAEKAGIIKPGVPVVIGETHPDTAPVFRRVAEEKGSPILFADSRFAIHTAEGCTPDLLRFTVEEHSEGTTPQTPTSAPRVLASPLAGAYQLKNLATLFGALSQLQGFGLTPDVVARGIANVIANTHLQGRWQVVGHDPLTICETAHNADGIRAMLAQVDAIPHTALRVVYGCVGDKDFTRILRLFPRRALFYFTQPSVPRRLPVGDLVVSAARMGIGAPGHPDAPPLAYPEVHAAIRAARADAAPTDLVLVTGSIFLVADALADPTGCQ